MLLSTPGTDTFTITESSQPNTVGGINAIEDAGAGDGALCTDGRSGVGSGLAVRGEVGELKTGVSIGVRSLASGTRGVSALVVGDTAGVAGTALGFGR